MKMCPRWVSFSNRPPEHKAGLRHAVVCPNLTGRTKKRIGQSKRALAGSLALVD